mgnify:CR=1 FL=1
MAIDADERMGCSFDDERDDPHEKVRIPVEERWDHS